MEWVLVALAVGLVVILLCGIVDEIAYWWAQRRTDPRRLVRDGHSTKHLRGR